MKFRLIFASFAAVLALAAGETWAASGLTLHDFEGGKPAFADSVDENFSALERAVPVMWASIDQDNLSVQWTSSTPVIINELVQIDVPDDGILLINGSVFVKNNIAAPPKDYLLNLLIDGLPPSSNPAQTFVSYFSASPDTTINLSEPGELFTLAYTYAVAVSAGPHDVSQTLASAGIGHNFIYNKNNLTVIFFPNLPLGIPIQNPGISADADTVNSENGQF
ncbi:MAG: hypothetical protein JSV26_08735 [bacterium]|nr:MAG: hypothetical protein JSV26_08735 [bacterium]